MAKPLGDVCHVIGGGTPSKRNPAFYEGDVPWATVRDMRHEILRQTEFRITEAAIKNSSTNVIPAGNVVIATRVGLGKVCLLEQDTAINQDLRGIVPKADNINVRFLFRWFQSIAHRIEAEGTGATVKGVKLPFIKSLPLPLPALTEQQRIVATLDEAFEGIDTAIANTEKNLANVRELFESHLDSIFNQCNESWGAKSLKDICTFTSGGTPSKRNQSYWGGEVPWVSGRDMKSTRIADSQLHITQLAVDESSTRIAPAGAILVLVRGMGLAHGAQIAELLEPCAFNQDIKAIQPDSSVIPRYLVFSLKHRINYSQNVMSSAAHGTLKIDMEALQQVPIPVPSISEQERIIEVINELVAGVERVKLIYQKKLAALTELKQSLLKKAFSGELTAGLGEMELASHDEVVA